MTTSVQPAFANQPIAKDARFQNLALALSRNTLESMPWQTQKDRLISLSLDSSLYDALHVLSNNNIHAAPVFDQFNTFWGFTDMQQIVRYVVRLCTGLTYDPPTASWFEQQQKLKETTIRDLITASKTRRPIYGEFSWPITAYSSLYQAFERMAREGQHRMAVQDPTGRATALVTQTMIMRWLRDNLDSFGSGKNVTVGELRPYRVVASINESAIALRAFEIMDSKRWSMNGVAVVDINGKLTDVISTSDLKGILPGSFEFGKLWDTVSEFKRSIRRRFPKSRWPVTVRTTQTLDDVIRAMADKNVHRVFVVNTANVPIDCISSTDVMRYLLDKMTDRPLTWW